MATGAGETTASDASSFGERQDENAREVEVSSFSSRGEMNKAEDVCCIRERIMLHF